jgi:hypothetical protein
VPQSLQLDVQRFASLCRVLLGISRVVLYNRKAYFEPCSHHALLRLPTCAARTLNILSVLLYAVLSTVDVLKALPPMSIATMEKIFSLLVFGATLPNPTLVKLVQVKNSADMYDVASSGMLDRSSRMGSLNLSESWKSHPMNQIRIALTWKHGFTSNG